MRKIHEGVTAKGRYQLCVAAADGELVVFMSSRFNNDAQSRYSPIEGEALMGYWACCKTDYFIYSCDKLYIGLDHKPLLAFFQESGPKTVGTHCEQTSKKICFSNQCYLVHIISHFRYKNFLWGRGS